MRSLEEALRDLPRATTSASEVYDPPAAPVCPICKGAGWVLLDVPLGHPSFARPLRCECSRSTENKARAAEMRRLSQLDGLEMKSFADFQVDTPALSQALDAAKSFAQTLQGWLVLVGGVGTGKTHLAAAIANEVLDHGEHTVMFSVAPDLLDHLRATFDPGKGIDYDDRFQEIRNSFLLILDDLGTENATPWAREKLYQIINHRYNEGLPTVITTNQLEGGIDERILSRILDRDLSQRIILNGDDYRRRGDPTYVRGRKRAASR